MSILSVDQIQPIGSGTTITLNATEVKTGTEITVGTGASIFSPAGNTLTLGTNNTERLRITNAGALGLSGTNYGSSGQVLTSAGSGSAPTWSAIPAQVTIANNADNRVITGGSGVNLNGEANLTFDGTTLTVSGNASANSVQSSFGGITTRLGFVSGSAEGVVETTSNHSLVLGVNSNEKLRIASAGQIGLGGANYGTSGQVLTSQGSGSAVQWASIYNERYTVSNITGTSQINVTNLGNDPHEICINFHMLKGVSDPCAILLRLGTSGGLYSSMGYNQTWTYFNNTSSNVLSNSRNHDQNAFWLYNNNFTSPLNIYSGNITLRRTIIGTYLLAGSAMSDRSENNNQYSNFTNGRVDISGACTQLRIYVDNGTNFAQGSVTVRTID